MEKVGGDGAGMGMVCNSMSLCVWRTNGLGEMYRAHSPFNGHSRLSGLVIRPFGGQFFVPSVLWRCWFGVRKSNRPVKSWVIRCLRGYLEQGANDLHMVQLMPLPPHHLLLHQNPNWFTLSGAGLPRLSWEKRPLNGCVSVWLSCLPVFGTDFLFCSKTVLLPATVANAIT